MNNIELINKYFENSLTPQEQILLKDLLTKDEAFKKEFVFQKDVKSVIAVDQRENLKSTLQGFEKNFENYDPPFKLPKLWLVAASVILLISLGFWFVKDTYYPSNEKIYTENFEPYRNIIHPVVRGQEINTIEYKAFVAYENREFHKAINLFNSSENSEAVYSKFYKAMCYLEINKSSEAINLLLPIATSSNEMNNLNEKSNWYLALAYLKNGERQKAISQFSLIANHPENSFKKEEARKILEALN